MPPTASQLTSNAPAAPNKKPAAPLTRTLTSKTKAQERAERELLAKRQAWDIDAIISAQESVAPNQKIESGQLDWGNLLDAVTKRSVTSWINLDKALAPFCMGATGPMNPKTGQYLTEIRMFRDQEQQVERVAAGIETLRPFLKIYRGAYEFRIKCLGASTRDKNWLSLGKDGKARVVSSVRPEVAFCDLRAALEFIFENRAAGGNS